MRIVELARNLGLERDDYISLMRVFLQTTTGDLDELDTALEENDLVRGSEIAHHIRGASINLGLQKIAEAARATELSAKRNGLEAAIAAARSIRAELQSTSRTIGQLSE